MDIYPFTTEILHQLHERGYWYLALKDVTHSDNGQILLFEPLKNSSSSNSPSLTSVHDEMVINITRGHLSNINALIELDLSD